MESGDVPAHLVQAELARIIPVRWDWEAQQLGAKSFVVPFPSKEELDRMIAIKTLTTRNKEGTIAFAEFVDDVQPIRLLEQVWVTVTKVPRALRSFLPLWAVGTMIGATQKVDMIHLRATGQVRILVAVFDVKKIPKFADVCVGSGIYRLLFKPDEAVQIDPIDPEDDGLLGDDLDGGDREMEDAEAHNPQNPQNNTKASDKTSAPPQNLPPQKQAALVEEALDLACTQLINEISIRVMLESEDGDKRKTFSPLTVEELTDYNKLVDSSNKINPSSVFLSSPATSTDHAELGGSTSPTAPFLALESGVAATTSGDSLPGYPSPIVDPLAGESSTPATAMDKAVGGGWAWGVLHQPNPYACSLTLLRRGVAYFHLRSCQWPRRVLARAAPPSAIPQRRTLLKIARTKL